MHTLLEKIETRIELRAIVAVRLIVSTIENVAINSYDSVIRTVSAHEIVTHVIRLDGRNISEASRFVDSPESNIALIYIKLPPKFDDAKIEWLLIHDNKEYSIIAWKDINSSGSSNPIAMLDEGYMIYFLRLRDGY